MNSIETLEQRIKMANQLKEILFEGESYLNQNIKQKYGIREEEHKPNEKKITIDKKPEDFLRILKSLFKRSKDKIAANIISSIDEDSKLENLDYSLSAKAVKEEFEKNLLNAGIITRKSKSKSTKNTFIGKLYKLFNGNSNNVKLSLDEELVAKLKGFSVKESSLYNDFKELVIEGIKQRYRYNDENDKCRKYKIECFETADLHIPGKWINPDILLKLNDFYYSYELKRWEDMSPIAPHEARNHARHISNYPHVVIEVPNDLFELVIEINVNFKIIREDCRERGIGLILFDKKTKMIMHLLDAEFFMPDPINRINFINALNK